MKKIIYIIIVVTAIIGILYVVYSQFLSPSQIRCEEGFRFNPQTRECQSIEVESDEIDFTQIPVRIPGESQLLTLEKNTETGQYSNTFQANTDTELQGFVSLDESEIIKYSDSLVVVPFLVNSGGTGQFVYIGLFDTEFKIHLTSVFVGDRIGIDAIELLDDKIIVSFKVRTGSQGYASEPTLPVEMVLSVEDGSMKELIRIENATYRDVEIKNKLPLTISNTTKIQGAIPGSWYFEAIAQYRLFSESYEVIGLGYVEALSDWMTTQRVPFELELNASSIGYTGSGVLVIESENVEGGEEGEKRVKRMYIPVEIR